MILMVVSSGNIENIKKLDSIIREKFIIIIVSLVEVEDKWVVLLMVREIFCLWRL